ncbi:30S ribosomal protein S5 [Planctellipticum variicoloris]|uniref:30S ribosomal protein S5 n=1 Tax=Planctellipticum variicoloris TaxID=3064265 RepID=UPI002CA952F3|nr:30S ribosomal protein S5 [Planctomycetaceae bacterium SH412]HTN01101.1 30S ribosomal protein S5 [Planctomycetaceae bacterium]
MASDSSSGDSPEKVVQIRRCACVVKGGRRFSFTALVVVGDGQGRVGYGYGKGVEVPQAVEKAVKQANRRMIRVPMRGTTIPHQVYGKFGTSQVMFMPANAGTGIIAGAGLRAIAESLGIKDVLTKGRGSNNPMNVVKAAFVALKQLRTREDVARLRGVEL